jgi:hypothetical protein
MHAINYDYNLFINIVKENMIIQISIKKTNKNSKIDLYSLLYYNRLEDKNNFSQNLNILIRIRVEYGFYR